MLEEFLGIDIGKALLLVMIALDEVDGINRFLFQSVAFPFIENNGTGI